MTAEIVKNNENGKLRYVKITLSNGTFFKVTEDIEGLLEITKEHSDKESSISVTPRYSNQITII